MYPPNPSILPFDSERYESENEFVTAKPKIIIPSRSESSISDAFGICILDAARIATFNAEIDYRVEIRHENLRSPLLFGLVNPANSKGIAISIDPGSGAIVDELNGSGVLGYLSTAPLIAERPVLCELQIQKFGRNHICTAFIDGEAVNCPAFVSANDLTFNAIVGCDSTLGSIAYRDPELVLNQKAKVA